MDCKRAMELMTQFINGQLNTEDVEAFLDHVESCPECREELEVNYSLMTAMKQLDEDTDLSDNYIEDLNQKIAACYIEEWKRKRACARRRAVLVFVVILLILQNGISLNKKREEEDRQFFRKIAGIEDVHDTQEDSSVMMAQEEAE